MKDFHQIYKSTSVLFQVVLFHIDQKQLDQTGQVLLSFIAENKTL